MPQRELRDFHTSIIQHRGIENWSILLFKWLQSPQNGNALWPKQPLWKLETDPEIRPSLKDRYLGFLAPD